MADFPHIIHGVNHGKNWNAPCGSRVVAGRRGAMTMQTHEQYYFIVFYCWLSIHKNKPVDNLWIKCVLLYFLLTRNLSITSYYYCF